MDGDHVSGGLADRTPADFPLQLVLGDVWDVVWDGLVRGQPAGVVVASGVVAGAGRAVEERHSAEAGEAAAQRPQILPVSPTVAIDEEEGVSFHDHDRPPGAGWGNGLLAVSGEQEAVNARDVTMNTSRTFGSFKSRVTRVTWNTLQTQ